ncbi:paraquat-inducible protein A [Rhizosaccharibacter radicis]|uniref:Paraquat-inducible protein A n=1 Tax=Rhizosaccharibacter radicis TaxID=2782605 RepID=A0ABT1VZX4_9PROT|nr:paraquat-inducible protein A [Acetobacteraceae bacterium KSS12]
MPPAPRKTARVATSVTAHPRIAVIDTACECHSCGFFQHLPELEPGQVASCQRCGAQIGRRRTNPRVSTPLAFTLTSTVLYVVAMASPLMTFDLYGRSRTVTLLTGPAEFMHENWTMLGLLVGFATALAPALAIGLMLLILYAASRPCLPGWAPMLLRWYERLRPWSMIEVYMLGVFVAYTKLIDLATVTIGAAVWALAALLFSMAATDSTLDTEMIWQRRRVASTTRRVNGRPVLVDTTGCTAETLPQVDHMVSCVGCGLVCAAPYPIPRRRLLGECPRCGGLVRSRKSQSLQRTVALLASAVILYIPANLYPVMTIVKLNRGGGHTILSGVVELYEAGMLPLALLVFFASITVPILKIVSLAIMCWCTWRGSAWRLVGRSRLYRLVDFIGRWSMIDVFMVSILIALVKFGGLGDIRAEPGAFAFAAVVVLTIFAANCFDPRLMWDAAGLNGVTERAGRGRASGRRASPVEAAAS